ncbi:MAG: WYL domain-containing protein [Lachnospiraceae bacterium]|nr:WYL domain-containing protein [Lachnospiraceae bacterium]
MPKSSGQKLKLLYLIRLLEEEGCESSPVSTSRIIQYLEANGIHAERKSIYDDVERLKEFGYDVIQNSSRLGGGYYFGSREFELPELKLLVDAVQSSRFITTKKSRDLIAKLEKKAGKHDATKLQRQVHVVGRVKTENEGIYYSIDAIHSAIQENRQIAFVYMDWNLQKEMVPRGDEERVISPWALVWQNENYYLIAYDGTSKSIKHFRVDKMGKVRVLDLVREGQKKFEKIDLASYSNQTFSMFGGKEESVTMSFPQSLIGVVIDRFGKDVPIRGVKDGTFRVRAKLSVSSQFFGWMAGLGKSAKIVSPDSVREQYREYLKEILDESLDLNCQ